MKKLYGWLGDGLNWWRCRHIRRGGRRGLVWSAAGRLQTWVEEQEGK